MARQPKQIKYSKDILEPIIESSYSWAEVLKSLSLPLSGGNYRYIQKYSQLHDLNTTHFTGQRWNKNKTAKTDSRIAAHAKAASLPASEILTNYSKADSKQLRRALLEIGRPYHCETVGCTIAGIWLGKEITLHVDHVNGKHWDNRSENLRFLCPNCHQQTPTWGKRKNGAVERT